MYLEKIIDGLERLYHRLKNRWSDFVYEQITQVRHKNELFTKLKELDGVYVHWDISYSLVSLVFAQFEMHYTQYTSRYYPIEKAAKPYLDEANNKSYDKETREHFKQWYKERKELYTKMYQIHQYIAKHRDYNSSVTDKLYTLRFEGCESEFVPYKHDPKLYELVFNKEPKNLSVKWKFDKEGKLIYSFKEVKNYTSDVFELENALNDKDTEIAKEILNNRAFMWD